MNSLSNWSLYYSFQNNINKVTWTPLSFWLDQSSSDLNTRLPTSHPNNPLDHLLKKNRIHSHTIIHFTPYFTMRNNLPLYYIFKIIPWVILEAFSINYNWTSLRYYNSLHIFIITKHYCLIVLTTSHMCDLWPYALVDIIIMLSIVTI